MKQLIIIKAGDTFEDVMQVHGGFDKWINDRLGAPSGLVRVVDVENGEELPEPSSILGAVMTGSHSMVSEKLEWSEKTAGWIRDAVNAGMPYFGICYGHQLLAHAMGGVADYNPLGLEIGTVKIKSLPMMMNDPLFNEMPELFDAHVIHSQSALELPAGAVRLAENGHDANHAFRVGDHAWGVQFHPEFSAEIMKCYLNKFDKQLAEKGVDYKVLVDEVRDTEDATSLLMGFTKYCLERS